MVVRLKYLQDFIDQKLRIYVEPARKGTARGERIGFSGAKYHASLLSALSFSKETDIAKKLDISYGVIRQWNIDDEFLKTMQRHVADFGTDFVEQISQLADRVGQTYMHPSRPSRNDLLNPKYPLNRYDCVDASLYGPGAVIGICIALYSTRQKVAPYFAMEAYRVLAALKLSHSKLNRPWIDNRYDMLLRHSALSSGLQKGMPSPNLENAVNLMERAVLDGIAKLLRQTKVSYEERKMVGFLLAMLSREVGLRLIEKRGAEKEAWEEKLGQQMLPMHNELSMKRKQ